MPLAESSLSLVVATVVGAIINAARLAAEGELQS